MQYSISRNRYITSPNSCHSNKRASQINQSPRPDPTAGVSVPESASFALAEFAAAVSEASSSSKRRVMSSTGLSEPCAKGKKRKCTFCRYLTRSSVELVLELVEEVVYSRCELALGVGGLWNCQPAVDDLNGNNLGYQTWNSPVGEGVSSVGLFGDCSAMSAAIVERNVPRWKLLKPETVYTCRRYTGLTILPIRLPYRKLSEYGIV